MSRGHGEAASVDEAALSTQDVNPVGSHSQVFGRRSTTAAHNEKYICDELKHIFRKRFGLSDTLPCHPRERRPRLDQELACDFRQVRMGSRMCSGPGTFDTDYIEPCFGMASEALNRCQQHAPVVQRDLP